MKLTKFLGTFALFIACVCNAYAQNPQQNISQTTRRGNAVKPAVTTTRAASAANAGDTSGMTWQQLADKCMAGQCTPEEQNVYNTNKAVLENFYN